jgi:glucose-6-phosphate dehydrogenase assembly protein OpcA
LWRAQLAAALDQPPYEPVLSATVSGAASSGSTVLLAAWLQLQLQVPVSLDLTPLDAGDTGIHGVRLVRSTGDIVLERPLSSTATLSQPNQPSQDLALPRRSLRDCLAEELRRLDPDHLYGEVITKGVGLLEQSARAGGGSNR